MHSRKDTDAAVSDKSVIVKKIAFMAKHKNSIKNIRIKKNRILSRFEL